MTFPTPQEMTEAYNKRWDSLKEEAKLIIAASMLDSYKEKEYHNGTKFKGGFFALHPRFFVIREWIVQEFAKAGWAVDTSDLDQSEDGVEFFAVNFENRQV